MTIPVIAAADVEDRLDWLDVAEAIAEGHRGPRAAIGDLVLRREADTLLTRAAWRDGLGAAVKAVTVTPGNAARGLASVHGALLLFDDVTGVVEAVVDARQQPGRGGSLRAGEQDHPVARGGHGAHGRPREQHVAVAVEPDDHRRAHPVATSGPSSSATAAVRSAATATPALRASLTSCGRVTGVGTSTVKSRLARGRRALHAQLVAGGTGDLTEGSDR